MFYIQFRIVSKLFFFFLGFAYVGLGAKAVWALEQTVKKGQYFWQISSLGHNPSVSYIMGSRHNMCLNDNSLPIEIKKALRDSRIGILEINTQQERQREKLRSPLEKAIAYMPEGLTLSHFLGEEKVREIFNFFRFFVATYDTKDKDLERIFKTLMHIDVNNYEDFNRLNSQALAFSLSGIAELYDEITNAERRIQEIKLQSPRTPDKIIQDFIDFAYEGIAMMSQEENTFNDLDNSISSDLDLLFGQNQENCFSNISIEMDLFIEKSLFCDKKPIYPMETAVATLLVPYELEMQADYLYDIFHEMKNADKIDFRFFSWYSQTNSFKYLKWPFERFKSIAIDIYQDAYHQGMKLWHGASLSDPLMWDSSESMIDFLQKRGCVISSAIHSLIDAYMDKLQQKADFAIQVSISGRLMDEEIMEAYFGFNAELKSQERDIFSACFPDYRYAAKELEDDRQKEELPFLKEKEGLTTSRDPKMAQAILRLLDRGEKVFAVSGFAHLSGIIRRLRVAGYSVNPMHVSSPVIEAKGCK